MEWMDISTAHDTEAAIAAFKTALPGWWFSIGECQVSADASCGPTRESGHIKLVAVDSRFDNGFHADLPQPNTMANALRNVMQQALAAIAENSEADAMHDAWTSDMHLLGPENPNGR